MNKKGFTLVEILSTIVLIALLLGLGIPGVMKISENMKKRSYNTKVDLIEQAATLWGQDNKTRLQSDDCKIDDIDYKCKKIAINDLIDDDYLEADGKDEDTGKYIYNNPEDNSDIINRCVYIYKKNNRVYAKYSNDETETCVNSPDEKPPEIELENLCKIDEEIPFTNQTYLSYQILCNAKKSKKEGLTERTFYEEIPKTTPGKKISKEDERTLSITQDNYGNSYYFRGNVEDNYINFNNMCWRIVRIQGDGSVKLVLASHKGECNNDNLENNSGIISTEEDYYEKLSLTEENFNKIINGENSEEIINAWFDSFFKQDVRNKLKTDYWYENDKRTFYNEAGVLVEPCKDDFNNSIECNDELLRSYMNDNDTDRLYYDAGNRNFIKEEPSLVFEVKNESYKKYLNGLTADEVIFAGYRAGDWSEYVYLGKEAITSYTISISSLKLMSGFTSQPLSDRIIYWKSNGSLNSGGGIGTKNIRPSIILKENTQIKKGNGTITEPYSIY